MSRLQDFLDEGKGNIPISVDSLNRYSKQLPKDMKDIHDKLADVRRNFEALDNAVGGTSMMKGINKTHEKVSRSLNDFTWELKNTVKEYESLLKEKK
jgi:archaellum component FlaC